MKILGKLSLLLIAAMFGLFALIMIASESSGEVVVLETQDEQGETITTRLWVADHDGYMWLRAGGEDSGWYQRLMAQVVDGRAAMLHRDDTAYVITAAAVPTKSTAINDLMAAKYGWGGRVVNAFAPTPPQDIAVRLEVQQ